MIAQTENDKTRALEVLLRDHILAAGGMMSFADYMNTVLYHPTLGYYERSKLPMGREGDFMTAPELSPLFAECLASACYQVMSQLQVFDLIEYGAGSGQLAIDLMRAFKRQGVAIHRYIIIEASGTLRSQQAERINTFLGDQGQCVTWQDAPPDGFCGVVIANEVLDALPCHTFSVEQGRCVERGVVFAHEHFSFAKAACFSPHLHDALVELSSVIALPQGYSSEVNLSLAPFLQRMTQPLKQAVIFFIDYGYGQAEYYDPRRVNGTLSCFYQHHYHDDPFQMPGRQDITAHVDFTRLADAALAYGLMVAGFTTQASFLLSLGLMEKAESLMKGCSEVEKFKMNQSIKRLTFPMEMGETIKVMALTKGVAISVPGFHLKDRRSDL